MSEDADLSLETKLSVSCALHPDVLARATALGFSLDLFTGKLSTALARAILSLKLAKKATDPASIYDEIASGDLAKRLRLSPDDLARLRTVLSETHAAPSEGTVRSWIERLEAKRTRRSWVAYHEAAVKALETTPDEKVRDLGAATVQKALALVQGSKGLGSEDPTPSAKRLAWMGRQRYGPACGFGFIDSTADRAGLGGLVPGQITAVVAPTGEGKSTSATSMAANMTRMASEARWWVKQKALGLSHRTRWTEFLEARAAVLSLDPSLVMEQQQGIKIIYFSAEMPGGALVARCLQNLCAMNPREEEAGGYGPVSQRLHQDWSACLDRHMYIYDQVFVASEIITQVALLRAQWDKARENVVVVIDHCHKINGLEKPGDMSDERTDLFYKMMYDLFAAMAVKEHVHVLALDQMNDKLREEWKTGNDVSSFAIRDGGGSLQAVDNAILLGFSNKKQNASLGWVKKARYMQDSRILESPVFIKAEPEFARLSEISQAEYSALPDKAERP